MALFFYAIHYAAIRNMHNLKFMLRINEIYQKYARSYKPFS